MKTAVFTLGSKFMFTMSGKETSEIVSKVEDRIWEMLDYQDIDIIMYIDNNIERVWSNDKRIIKK